MWYLAACMSVHAQLWASVWVLGMELGPLTEQPVSLTIEPALQHHKFKWYLIMEYHSGGRNSVSHLWLKDSNHAGSHSFGIAQAAQPSLSPFTLLAFK